MSPKQNFKWKFKVEFIKKQCLIPKQISNGFTDISKKNPWTYFKIMHFLNEFLNKFAKNSQVEFLFKLLENS